MVTDNITEFIENHRHKPLQGYVWWSDSTTPVVYDGTKTLDIEKAELERHFIIEALLCGEDQSYMIKYIDGVHRIYTYELKCTEDMEDVEMSFIPHRIPGVSKLKFVQRWRLAEDALCMNMKVLQPAEFIFKGFEK